MLRQVSAVLTVTLAALLMVVVARGLACEQPCSCQGDVCTNCAVSASWSLPDAGDGGADAREYEDGERVASRRCTRRRAD